MEKYSKKILIAEDEDSIRESLGELVHSITNCEIDLAADGRSALNKIKKAKNDYGIVLTDLKMPRLDGMELIKLGKDVNDELIFIVITGYATKENAISALRRGAYDFVHKPFNVDEFRAVLNRAIEYSFLLEENKKYQTNLEKLVAERTLEIQELNEDLKKLLNLSQETSKIKQLEIKISRYQTSIIERFDPNTAILMYYDNLEGQFRIPCIYSRTSSDIHLPDSVSLLSSRKQYFYSKKAGKKISDKKLHINKADTTFLLHKLEHEVFLGYFYIGFKSNTNFQKIENSTKLYISNMEAMLFNDYLETFHKRELETMFVSGIKTISDTVEANSPYTRKHSDRVERYAAILAEALGFSYDRKYLLKIACILHDIGKVAIERDIVYKPSHLTQDEMKAMQRHAIIGSNIVKNLYGFKLDHIIKHHHEQWNGTGYPDGLSGDAIPLESRIIAIADAFDAMVTTRPYRIAKTLEEAIAELKNCAGTQFDPELVDKFIEAIEENSGILQLIITESGKAKHGNNQDFNS